MNIFTCDDDKTADVVATLRQMVKSGGGKQETAGLDPFEALLRRVAGKGCGLARETCGVTACGRYGYRYDEEGRFFAVLLPGDPGYLDRFTTSFET